MRLLQLCYAMLMSFEASTNWSAAPDLPPGSVELGRGEPLILLHGVMGSSTMWRGVMPALAETRRVIALSALGHHRGQPCASRPCRIEHVVDNAERALDALGIDRAHIAGNSMGGWMALELARRGRALSVCALSPAGMWESTKDLAGADKLRSTVRITRLTRGSLPLTAKLGIIRRFALRDSAEHGERVSPAMLVELADALLECSVAEDLLSTPEKFAPLEVRCPVDVAWSQHDRIFPMEPFARNARARLPGARHLVLAGVGHVPMFDDPELVARTILDTMARTTTDHSVHSLQT